MSPDNPVALTLPYLAGLALGAALRGGFGRAGDGLAMAAAAALGPLLAAGRFPGWQPGDDPGGGSWYQPRRGRGPGGSFWRPPSGRLVVRRGLLFLTLGVAGAARMWFALGPPVPPLAELTRLFPPASGRQRVIVRGTVAARPERSPDGWQVLVRPEGRAGRSGLIRLMIRVEAGGGARGPGGKAGDFPWSVIRPGTRLAVPVKLHRPVPANPGEQSFDGISEYGRLAALGWAFEREVQLKTGPGGTRRAREGLFDRARERLAGFLDRGARPPGRGILRALVLGDRSDLTDEVEEDFARAGAVHLLVVSGLHLSVVVAFLGEAGSRLGLGRKGGAALAAGGAVGYATLTGWQPPVTRAALMALAALGATWCGRPRDTERALWAAVLLMLLHRPLLFFDAGFRLTVAATWGVVAIGPLLAERFRATDALGRGWCTALGAQMATAPLTLVYFGRMPLAAVAASPVLVGLGAGLVEAGCAGGALGLTVPLLAAPLSAGLGVTASLLWWAVRAVGRIPWATVNLPGPPEWLVALYYVGLGVGRETWRTAGAWPGEMRRAGLPLARGVLLAAGGVALALSVNGRSPWLQATFLSVGEGDALHLHLPGGVFGPHLMVDAGPSPGRPRTYLRRAGVQTLAALVLTHAHRDHAGGADGLRHTLPIGRLIAPGAIGGRATTASGVDVLVTPSYGVGGENEASRRVVIRYGRLRLLTTGDAPLTAADPVLAYLPPRDTPAGRDLFLVVKVPHHGARGAVTREFLDAYRPDLAVVSVGPNGYGHPDRALLALLRQRGIPVWRTDQAGAIRLATDGRRVRIRAFGHRANAG